MKGEKWRVEAESMNQKELKFGQLLSIVEGEEL